MLLPLALALPLAVALPLALALAPMLALAEAAELEDAPPGEGVLLLEHALTRSAATDIAATVLRSAGIAKFHLLSDRAGKPAEPPGSRTPRGDGCAGTKAAEGCAAAATLETRCGAAALSYRRA